MRKRGVHLSYKWPMVYELIYYGFEPIKTQELQYAIVARLADMWSMFLYVIIKSF